MLLDIYYMEQNYSPEYKSCCFHNCIRQILDSRMIKYPHLMINTSYDYYYEKNDSLFGFTAGRKTNQILLNGLDDYVIDYDVAEWSNRQVFEQNIELLKYDIPVIVGLDPYFLPYDSYYKKNNANHYAILCGYDEQFEDVYLIDVREKIRFKGKLKLTNFLLSRSSQNPKGESLYSGHPIDNCFSIILDIENSRIDYYKLMMENICNSLKYYEGSIESANSGINILVKIMNRFTELSVDNSIGLEPLIDYTHGILYDINKYRKMFSLYLYTMNCYFNTVTTEEYELFQGITSQWGILLQLFIKIELSKNINLLEKVLAIFSLVYKQENSFYTSLLSIYNRLNG